MDTITTTTAALPLATAKSIASLAVFADKPKSATPALQVIQLTFTEDSVIAVATDRYCAARVKFNYSGPAIGSVYVDHAGAKFITGLLAKPGVMVEFSIEANGQLIIAYQQYGDYQATHYAPRYLAKFPAIESILDGHKPGTSTGNSFTVEFLGKLGKVVGIDGKKITVWHLEPGESVNPNRPSPSMATSEEFQVLIQPNLKPRQ
jgi:hypothetical protein